jgi:hypothetical protein
MRALMLPPAKYAAHCALDEEDREEHVFPMDESDAFKDHLKYAARAAHMHVLIAAYRRSIRNGDGLGPEPPIIKEMVDELILACDPRIDKALEYIDARLDFAPQRPPDKAGHTFYAWVREKDLNSRSWDWYESDVNKEFRDGLDAPSDKLADWKKALASAMKMRGRSVQQIRPTVNGIQLSKVKAYDRIAWLAATTTA